MLGISSTIGSIIGSFFGIAQGYVEKKQDNDLQLQLKKMDIENTGIVSAQRVAIQKEETITEEQKTLQADDSSYAAFANAVNATSSPMQSGVEWQIVRIQNFITATTRPVITYTMLILIFFIVIKSCNMVAAGTSIPDSYLAIIDLVITEFSAITAYWFIRRSYEKNLTSFSSLLKKSNNFG